jgi:acetate kinase
MSRVEQPVWTFNAGSSSIKCAIFAGERACVLAQVEALGTSPRLMLGESPPESLAATTTHAQALDALLNALSAQGYDLANAYAVGHRLVHGGTAFQKPVLIDAEALSLLNPLRKLAPLHNGYGLDIIEYLLTQQPTLRQIACFDTAFHATLPDTAVRFALPERYYARGYRRFGFHGINYEYLSEELRASGAPKRVLAFHLGNGCSIAAINDHVSVATTMGYSTLDGLIMGTRTGSIDPGLLIALQRDEGLSLAQLEQLLYREAGLLGLSGLSNDMRRLESSSEPAAQRAIEHFVMQAARQAAALVPMLGGVDALVFSGGIGFGSATVRARIVALLAFLGFQIDPNNNATCAVRIEAADHSKPIYVMAANEEKMLSRHVYRILDQHRTSVSQ